MPVDLILIVAGVATLVALRLLRSRFRGWTKTRTEFRMVGYFLPLAGVGAILIGTGMFWEPEQVGWLNGVLLIALLGGLVCLLLLFLTTIGVPMPPVLLPRWYRRQRPPKPTDDEGVAGW